MAIDTDPLTHLVVDQSKIVWSDFLSLFNSEYALLYFGIGGIVMGVTAQYNGRLSKKISNVSIWLYKRAKILTMLVGATGLIAIISYIWMPEGMSQPIIATLKKYPWAIYIFLLSIVTAVFVFVVNWLNKPYPSLKNNVAALGLHLGFIYFLFEVQDLGVLHPYLAITIAVFLSFVIYRFGDFSMDKEKYLKNELEKTEERKQKILRKLEKLQREKQEEAEATEPFIKRKKRPESRKERLRRERKEHLERKERRERLKKSIQAQRPNRVSDNQSKELEIHD